MTWWCAVTPGSRPSRSRRGWPGGWSREGWRSAKPRPGSFPFLRGSIFSDLISAATPTASCSSNRAPWPSRGSGTGLRGSSARSAGPTSQQYWRKSSRSHGAGSPTTGRWYRPGCSMPWTTTCGSSPISGRAGATRVSRKAGSPAGTSGSSRSSGTTGGYSAIKTLAPTCRDLPGPISCGIPWLKAGRPPMTPPWPGTGRNADRRSNPRWTLTPCACYPGRTGGAAYAGKTC